MLVKNVNRSDDEQALWKRELRGLEIDRRGEGGDITVFANYENWNSRFDRERD